MIVERNYADRIIILLRELMPIFPDDYLPQLQSFEQQLSELSIDEELIIFVIHFLKKYLLNKDDSQKRTVFFEESDEKKDNGIDEMCFKVDELIVALNWLIDGHNKTKFKGIIR